MITTDGTRVYGDTTTAAVDGERLITDVVTCPDCGHEADPVMGGNHGGQCTAATNRGGTA